MFGCLDIDNNYSALFNDIIAASSGFQFLFLIRQTTGGQTYTYVIDCPTFQSGQKEYLQGIKYYHNNWIIDYPTLQSGQEEFL